MRHRGIGLFFASLAGLLLTGCSTGYTKINGRWTYIVINEAVGREVRKIDADMATFRVLEDANYACDKNHVYREGVILPGIDGASFELLEDGHFARDKNRVYFDDCVVIGADRDTFRVLGYPYGRDAKNIYYGCLRMNVAQPEKFRVLNEEEGEVKGTHYYYSTADLVEWLGEEFSDRQVLYEEKGNDNRYRIATALTGTATDDVWVYEGAKRSRPVR